MLCPSVFLQPRIKFAAGVWKREGRERERKGRGLAPPRAPRGDLAMPDMETASEAEVRGRTEAERTGELEMGESWDASEVIFHRSVSLDAMELKDVKQE